MAASPRIRRDLKVETAQDEAGVLYYDVSDPRTGGSLRLFDFEWLIAERIDGRSFEELARFAQSELGLETSAEDLSLYAQRLGQLGVLDMMAAELPLPEAAPARRAPTRPPLEAAATLVTEPPEITSAPSARSAPPRLGAPLEAAETLVSAPPVREPSRPAEAPRLEAAETLISAPLPEASIEARPETQPETKIEARVDAPPAEAQPETKPETKPEPKPETKPETKIATKVDAPPEVAVAPEPAPAPAAERGPAQVALTVDSAIDEVAAAAPAMPAQRPTSDSRPALALHSAPVPADDVMGSPLIPAAAGPVELPIVEPEPQPERKATLLMPTVVAPPAEPPRPASSLSERPTAPIATVEPAPPAEAPAAHKVEAPEVERVTLPPADAAPVRPAEQARPQTGEAGDVAAAAPVATEAGAPASTADTGSLPIDASGEMSPPEESAAAAAAGRQVTVTTEDEEEEAESGGGAGRWVALLILLLALGLCAYLLFGLRRPPSAQVQVKRAQPHEVSRTLGAKALVKKAPPQVLRMEGGGVLASVVAEGAEVSAGMSLAVLQSHAKLQKEISDLKERLAYYQRRREVATEKGDESAAKEAQSKVAEKEERLGSAEVALKKAQILAIRSGKVSRVLVHTGDLVSPGSEIVEIADRFLGAEVTLPQAEVQGLKVGEDVQLEGPAGVIAGRISSLTPKGAEVLVQLELPDENSAKTGDSLRLLRGRLTDVEALPGPAVVDGDTVFVVSQGKAERRKVQIVDHRGAEVLVTGLRGGEEVVVSGASDLREGQLVRATYGAR